jgi:hypothetical protein
MSVEDGVSADRSPFRSIDTPAGLPFVDPWIELDPIRDAAKTQISCFRRGLR